MVDYELVNLTFGSMAYIMPYAISAYQYVLENIKESKRKENSLLEDPEFLSFDN